MAQVKVEVLDAIVDGKRAGEQLTIDEESAKRFAAMGYVKVLAEVKPPTAKPAAKKPPARKAAAKK